MQEFIYVSNHTKDTRRIDVRAETGVCNFDTYDCCRAFMNYTQWLSRCRHTLARLKSLRLIQDVVYSTELEIELEGNVGKVMLVRCDV